ncbi:kinesin motor domain-containing protein, partial [Dipodascopsis uninucleata]
FEFDQVFEPNTTTAQVYQDTARSLVDAVIDGYSATMFAYGMTGTGKTHSMQGTSKDPGVVPRAIADVFTSLPAGATVSLSYLEIYNEHLKDLLAPETPSDALKIHDDPNTGEVVIRNLRGIEVNSASKVNAFILRGNEARKTEGTEHNSVSSRSHAIMQLTIKRSDGVRSTLSLCDLAGSERGAADEARRKEGAYINKSLLALGTIIARLAGSSSGVKDQHMPYRDSKLTRILQHGLSGRSLVNVLCTIHEKPTTQRHFNESVNTLRFASRVKNI